MFLKVPPSLGSRDRRSCSYQTSHLTALKSPQRLAVRPTRTRLHSVSPPSSRGPFGSAQGHILRNSSGCVCQNFSPSLTWEPVAQHSMAPSSQTCQFACLVGDIFPAWGPWLVSALAVGPNGQTYLSGNTDVDNSASFGRPSP